MRARAFTAALALALAFPLANRFWVSGFNAVSGLLGFCLWRHPLLGTVALTPLR